MASNSPIIPKIFLKMIGFCSLNDSGSSFCSFNETVEADSAVLM
jgi:hypothetical protein